jgi:hypothetical protein
MRRLKTLTNSLSRSGATLALLLGCAAFLGGCFSEPMPECAFACPADEECPEDYRCVRDGWCKRNDIAFDYQCSPAVLIDAATFDSARADADTTDADLPDAMPTM